MCERIVEKFGFQPVQEEHIDECNINPLILPKYWRYLGMGHIEILAEVNNVPNRYFIFNIFGSNGWDHIAYRDIFNKLSVDDSLTLNQITDKLERKKWYTIKSTENFENCSKITVQEHSN